MKNIYAHTSPGANYPGYISINETGGRVSISLRSNGSTTDGGFLAMGNHELQDMHRALGKYLESLAPAPAAKASTKKATTSDSDQA